MRNYGRFTTSIWRDEDFTSLTSTQQAVYFLLCTQPDVSAAGTLNLTLRRWAAMSADSSPDELRRVLGELENCPGVHLIVDDDTEEVLIRKFVKWDGGIRNEKRRPVIMDAAEGVSSTRIRHALALEIEHLGYVEMAAELWKTSPEGAPSDNPSEAASHTPSANHAETSRAATLTTAESGTESDTDSASDTQSRFDRVVVKKRNQRPQPTTQKKRPGGSATRIGHRGTSDAQAADASGAGPPPMHCSKHPDGTETPCGPCRAARLAHQAWLDATAAREAEERRQRVAAVAECDLCDSNGLRLDPDTRKPTGRCDHQADGGTQPDDQEPPR